MRTEAAMVAHIDELKSKKLTDESKSEVSAPRENPIAAILKRVREANARRQRAERALLRHERLLRLDAIMDKIR